MYPQIQCRNYSDVTILDAYGEFAESNGNDARAIILELVAEGRRQVVLNLENAVSLSSAAVEPLVSAAREVARLGGEIKLAGIGSASDDVLTMARLYAVFDIAEDHATAVCNFLMPYGADVALLA